MAVKKSKSVKLVEVKSEVGAGTRGASLGVDAIKIAALDFRSQFFKNNRAMVVPMIMLRSMAKWETVTQSVSKVC